MFNKNNKRKEQNQQIIEPPDIPTFPVSINMEENRKYIKETFHYTEDLIEKKLTTQSGKTLYLIYFDSSTDKKKLESSVFNRIYELKKDQSLDRAFEELDSVKLFVLSDGIDELLAGKSLLLIQDTGYCYAVGTTELIQREISEPENEKVIRGNHDGFIEHLSTNIQLVREIINHPSLVVRYNTIGEVTKTKTAILYMEGRCDPQVIEEVQRRLSKIKVDKMITPGIIEEYLEDNIYSMFPQFISTERADRSAINLIDGRIIVLVDGDPTALLLPITFFSFFQSGDDYNTRWLAGNFYRMIRVISFLLAVTLPGVYISVITFHYEIIPFGMTFVIKDAVEHIPYPPLLEAFFMELTLELIREAGIRLPAPIGQTIGIVGGLVIGDAVVNAGFVSSIMIIVVALTAIASFVVPIHEMSVAIRILRFPVMIMAALLGFVGIVFCLTIYLIHLCKLTSIGQPYFYPFAPFSFKGLLNRFIRIPHTIEIKDSEKDNQNKKSSSS